MLTPASLNMMLWFVLLYALHLGTRLQVQCLFYVLAMVLCVKMVSVIYKKRKATTTVLIGDAMHLHFIIDTAIFIMFYYY